MCIWLGRLHKVSHENSPSAKAFPEKSMCSFISSRKSKKNIQVSLWAPNTHSIKTLNPGSKLEEAVSSAFF